MPEAAISIGAAVLLAALTGVYFVFRSRPQTLVKANHTAEKPAAVSTTGIAHLPDLYQTDFYRLACHCKQTNTQLNATIIKRFDEHKLDFIQDASLLPRQPLILPKLLQAVKRESGDSSQLVNIILQDPRLTADVLKLSNSPMYRNSKGSISDMDYAVVVLGIDGLKSVICTSIMRPIFSNNSQGNKTLAPLMWAYGLAAASIAQRYAIKTQSAEAFTGHLLTLLSCIAELVITQAATRLFKAEGGAIEPKTLVHLIEVHGYWFTRELMQAWSLDATLVQELAHPEQQSNNSPLKAAQQLGRVLGRGVVMLGHKQITKQQLLSAFDELGVDEEMREFLLVVAEGE